MIHSIQPIKGALNNRRLAIKAFFSTIIAHPQSLQIRSTSQYQKSIFNLLIAGGDLVRGTVDRLHGPPSWSLCPSYEALGGLRHTLSMENRGHYARHKTGTYGSTQGGSCPLLRANSIWRVQQTPHVNQINIITRNTGGLNTPTLSLYSHQSSQQVRSTPTTIHWGNSPIKSPRHPPINHTPTKLVIIQSHQRGPDRPVQ